MASEKWWGKSLILNLHGCKKSFLKSPKKIKEYIDELIKILGMEKHGETYIDQFGEGNLKGWSALQFIKTSSITVHCDDKWNRVFIDIFSCKDYDINKAVKFSKEFFKSTDCFVKTLERT
tara:strand:- start:87 stop:446 length:360 start_codon:yes stop_codon:yes gene_type:complete